MSSRINLHRQLFTTLTLLLLAISCTTTTNEYIEAKNAVLPNGRRLETTIIEKISSQKGILSNHVYNTSTRFTYRTYISKDRVHWNGGSSEPKNIIFCNDYIYIRYLKEKNIATPYESEVDSTIRYDYTYEIIEGFQKHIDERYFFKLLGDDFWVDIPSEEYKNLKEYCTEDEVPNDNRLSILSDTLQ